MDLPYHITVFDNFHRHEPDEARVSGAYATAEAAIAAVKRKIDDELEYLWSEVCHQDKGIATLDRLISHYNSFAEMPVAFGADSKMIFDSTAYMIAKAAEVITKRPARYGPASPLPASFARQAAQRLIPSPPQQVAAKRGYPLFKAVSAFMNKPRNPTVPFVTFMVLCLLLGLIYRALR